MKNILILFALFLFIPVNAQVKGIDLSTALRYPGSNAEFEQLYYLVDKVTGVKDYMICYHHNVMGIKHCLDKTKDLLYNNGLDFEHPTFDKSYLPEYVKDYSDYGGLNTACASGSGEVVKYYDINDHTLTIAFTYDNYTLYLFHKKQ